MDRYLPHNIYSHLLHEGIGLKQLLDYYFLLKNSACLYGEMSIDQMSVAKGNAIRVLSDLGIAKFASAVMWIMKEQYLLDDSLLLCPVNEREGRFLFDEALAGGNLGSYDDRKMTPSNNLFVLGLQHALHNLRLLTHYPSETLWAPWWKVWHYCWCRYNGFGEWK